MVEGNLGETPTRQSATDGIPAFRAPAPVVQQPPIGSPLPPQSNSPPTSPERVERAPISSSGWSGFATRALKILGWRILLVAIPVGLLWAEGRGHPVAEIVKAWRTPPESPEERRQLLELMRQLDQRIRDVDARVWKLGGWAVGATETTSGADVLPNPGAPPAAVVSVGPAPMPEPQGKVRRRPSKVQLRGPELGVPLEPLTIPDE